MTVPLVVLGLAGLLAAAVGTKATTEARRDYVPAHESASSM